jgi:hypothetical protein
MSGFVKSQGICFLFGNELSATILSKVLCKITNFLQEVAPYTKLQKYDDWWEHDGLHFHRKESDFDALFQMINSPKNLLESTPDDDSVFVGVAPNDNAWYLRYRVEWDDEESSLIGSCAVILPQPLADKFRVEVLQRLDAQAEEKDSEAFYQEIVL